MSGPDFFILGAHKSGTSSLFNLLCQHPQIALPPVKEMQFFNHNDRYSWGTDWYDAQFKIPAGQVTLDATPDYLVQPQVPERLFNYHPKAKLIVLLREPVERAYAAWNMYSQVTFPFPTEVPFPDPRDFESAILEELTGKETRYRYLETGRYILHLRRYQKWFPKNQILVLDFDTLRSAQTSLANQCFAFLGLQAHPITSTHLHAGNYQQSLPPHLKPLLEKQFHDYNRLLVLEWKLNFNWLPPL